MGSDIHYSEHRLDNITMRTTTFKARFLPIAHRLLDKDGLFLSLLLVLGVFLIGQIPVAQVSDADREVGAKSEPGDIWHQTPARDTVNRTPEIGQVAINADQGHKIGGRLGGSPGDEEQRHPRQIQAELDGVQRRAVLGGADGAGRVQRRGAVVDGTVRGVAHQAV